MTKSHSLSRPVRHFRSVWTSLRWLPAGAVAMVAAHAPVAGPAHGQATFSSFTQLGCYDNPTDQKIWVAAYSHDPKYNTADFYEDPDNPFAVIVKGGDQKIEVDGQDVTVHPMSQFNYKGAEKYQFIKYAMVVDYSSSIPEESRQQVLGFITDFIDKLPLAVEGQIIRFSDAVEVLPPTSSPAELKAQLAKPMVYGLTALHDAIMEGVTQVSAGGAATPVRALIIFTDGMDTASKVYTDRAGFITSFQSLAKQNKLAVIAIGVTPERDDELLQKITDNSAGVYGFYRPITEFSELGKALDSVQHQIKNTVLFRIPPVGPRKGPTEISIGTKTKGGAFNTLMTFQCNF